MANVITAAPGVRLSLGGLPLCGTTFTDGWWVSGVSAEVGREGRQRVLSSWLLAPCLQILHSQTCCAGREERQVVAAQNQVVKSSSSCSSALSGSHEASSDEQEERGEPAMEFISAESPGESSPD